MRDLKAVGKKFVHVMYPKKSSTLLRDCTCWDLPDLQRRGRIQQDRDSGVLNILRCSSFSRVDSWGVTRAL